jgi:hypothetical protein
MLDDFRIFLIDLLTTKGEETMLAMLWANQIILGKKTFKQVPAKLKEQVREILIDAGCEDLTEE